jgi:hypothetical protein
VVALVRPSPSFVVGDSDEGGTGTDAGAGAASMVGAVADDVAVADVEGFDPEIEVAGGSAVWCSTAQPVPEAVSASGTIQAATRRSVAVRDRPRSCPGSSPGVRRLIGVGGARR